MILSLAKFAYFFLISHCKTLKGLNCNELQLGAAFKILLSVMIRYYISYKRDVVFRIPSNIEIIRNFKNYVDYS